MKPNTLDELGFKYAIGQVLIHKGMSHVKPRSSEEKIFRAMGDRDAQNCVRFVVIGRHATECSGGVQLHYEVTAVHGDSGETTKPILYHECELIPLPV